jgi:hypothetical protein
MFLQEHFSDSEGGNRYADSSGVVYEFPHQLPPSKLEIPGRAMLVECSCRNISSVPVLLFL